MKFAENFNNVFPSTPKKYIAIFLFFGYFFMFFQAEAAENSYKPDRAFLRNDPFKKSKARVELNGIHSEFELAVVRDSINDVLQLIRVFGLGNKLPNGQIISENTRLNPIFLKLTTVQGRMEIDIDPASTWVDKKTFNWNIISDEKFEVDVVFKHLPLSLGQAESPDERTYRFGFVKNKCGANWCLNTAKKITN